MRFVPSEEAFKPFGKSPKYLSLLIPKITGAKSSDILTMSVTPASGVFICSSSSRSLSSKNIPSLERWELANLTRSIKLAQLPLFKKADISVRQTVIENLFKSLCAERRFSVKFCTYSNTCCASEIPKKLYSGFKISGTSFCAKYKKRLL